MDWNSIWQGVATHWLAELLIFGASITLAWLKTKNPRWLGIASYGLAGFALMSIIVYTFTGRAILSRETPQTTTENVEANLRAWADDFQLGVTKLPSQPDVDFGLAITLKGGNPVEVRKVKQSPGYLQIQSNLVLSPDHQRKLAKLTEEQSAFVTEELSLELARSRIGFTIIGPAVQTEPQIQLVLLAKGAPISGLTETMFAEYMDEMDSAIRLSRTKTALILDRGPLHEFLMKSQPTAAQ